MVCSSWGQRRQRVELWVTWGSQGWAWTPCPLLRALPSPSDKEETEVIHRRQAMAGGRGAGLLGTEKEAGGQLPRRVTGLSL